MDTVLKVLPGVLAVAGEMVGHSLEQAEDCSPWAVLLLELAGSRGAPTHRRDAVPAYGGFDDRYRRGQRGDLRGLAGTLQSRRSYQPPMLCFAQVAARQSAVGRG